MAPESERANVYMPNCKHCGRVIYWHAAGMWAHYDDATARCDIRATPPDDSPAPTEPTLTCSEVVERLPPTYAEISTFMQKFFGCDYNETHKFGFDEVTRVVYAFCQSRESDSWRERRVQELEEALRGVVDACVKPVCTHARMKYVDDFMAPCVSCERLISNRLETAVTNAAKALAKSDEAREQIRKGAKHEF